MHRASPQTCARWWPVPRSRPGRGRIGHAWTCGGVFAAPHPSPACRANLAGTTGHRDRVPHSHHTDHDARALVKPPAGHNAVTSRRTVRPRGARKGISDGTSRGEDRGDRAGQSRSARLRSGQRGSRAERRSAGHVALRVAERAGVMQGWPAVDLHTADHPGMRWTAPR